MRLSIAMVLNLGLSGQPFSGPDIGGFGGETDPSLFSRWMGFGALLPFARAHKHEDTKAHEPWSFGPEVEKNCRVAIERRYRLLPLYYTLFQEAAHTGLPVMRPLFFADPADESLRAEDRAFLLGQDVLVRVNTEPGSTRPGVVMPSNTPWYPLTLDEHSLPDMPDMFVRAGAIVPTQDVVQYVDEKPLDDLTLIIALDSDGKAEGRFYNDEGDGYSHLDGNYVALLFRAEADEESLNLTVSRQGFFPAPKGTLTMRILLDGKREIVRTVPFSSDAISVPILGD
jgi:alpha-glucosidase